MADRIFLIQFIDKLRSIHRSFYSMLKPAIIYSKRNFKLFQKQLKSIYLRKKTVPT